MLELEKKSGRGYETFACAGQAAGERERVRSHDDLTLRGSGAGFNTNIQQNIFLFIGDEQAPNGAKEAKVEQTSNTEHRIQQRTGENARCSMPARDTDFVACSRKRSLSELGVQCSALLFKTRLIVAKVGGGKQIPTVLEIDLPDDFVVRVPVRGQPLRPASLPMRFGFPDSVGPVAGPHHAAVLFVIPHPCWPRAGFLHPENQWRHKSPQILQS